MRIGIDCRTILNPHSGERAGIGHYTYYLVKKLLKIDRENEYVLFFDSRFKGAQEFEQENVKIKFFPFYQYKEYLPVLYSQILVTGFIDREKLDLFHAPANTIPFFYKKPAVVTVHDLAIYKYPEFFPKKFLSRQIFSTKVLVPKSLEAAKKIIAVSKNTKKDIIEEFAIPEEKISVIYEGVLPPEPTTEEKWQTIKEKFGVKDKYILFLGTIEPRKNIVGLVKAFRNLYLRYDSPIKDYQLVIAGAIGWQSESIFEAVSEANAAILSKEIRRSGKERRSGLDARSEEKRKAEGERRLNSDRRQNMPVKHLGYVSHEEKNALLRHAFCFAFPSVYEGFGLPVLEAMSFGVPVITSSVSSLPEVVGEHGAILVDPSKESELVGALEQMATDEGLREELRLKGLARSQELSWKHCAAATLEIYREAAGLKNE